MIRFATKHYQNKLFGRLKTKAKEENISDFICFIEELALTFRLSNCPTSAPWRRNPDADSGVDLAKSLICNGARGRT